MHRALPLRRPRRSQSTEMTRTKKRHITAHIRQSITKSQYKNTSTREAAHHSPPTAFYAFSVEPFNDDFSTPEVRYDVLTLPFFTVKRRANREHGLLDPKIRKQYHQAKEALKKANFENHVGRYTSHVIFSGTFIHVFTPHSGSSVCVRDRTIFMPSMMTHERSSSFPCSHSSPLTLPSFFLFTSSTMTSQRTLPDQNTTAPNPRNEAYGSLAISQPLTLCMYTFLDICFVLQM